MNGPYAYPGQNLIQHLQNTSKRAETFAGRQYLRIVSDRIFVASNRKVEIGPERVGAVIRIASLLHDIGKADNSYQAQLEFTKSPRKSSFFLHEVPSAVIGDRVSNKLQLGWTESFLLSFSILNHHNAMRSLEEIRSRLGDRRRGWSFDRWNRSLRPLLDSISISDPSEVLKEIRLSEIESYLNRMEGIASDRNKTWTKLYSFILNPLIAGDNLDALDRDHDVQQSASRMKFIQELKEAIGAN